MKKNAEQTYKFAKANPVLFARFILVLLLLGSLTTFLFVSSSAKSEARNNILGASISRENTPFRIELEAPKVKSEDIQRAQKLKVEEEARIAEIRRKEQERKDNIARINNFLIKKKSPVANTKIAEMIYNSSKTHNYDYKIILAIMGVESGFCAQSFSYNCFGYLNGAKYSSYEHAFADLLPKVGRQYAQKYSTDFVSLAKAYGVVNWQKGAANLEMYYNQI